MKAKDRPRVERGLAPAAHPAHHERERERERENQREKEREGDIERKTVRERERHFQVISERGDLGPPPTPHIVISQTVLSPALF